MRKYTARKSFMVSVEEKAAIVAAAALLEISVSEFMRRVVDVLVTPSRGEKLTMLREFRDTKATPQ